ncbi:hypothetical protein [Dyella tabacisoli]|uniref:Tetratricopeptide repeat protein n=1 Tax=Dyella tabacisoli TaxID=2282381 RepID=A0A369UHP0_9GAMM|nr:hypothetical protein [Dyella tabacisoli]RDD80066.1 hypothetical protein DVJ77_19550 [Dyella tabacisoli]
MSGHKDHHDPEQHGRTEPTLGDIDHLDEPSPLSSARDGLPHVSIDPERRRPAPPPRPKRARKRGWLLPLLLLIVIGVIAFAWVEQDRLRGLVPSTELNDVLGRADQAFQNGRLDGNDGHSARELFEAARALEPDNDRARDGLRKVGLAEVSRADAALQAGRLDDADQALAAARELLGGGSDVERLTQAMAKVRGATVQTGSLIEQAQKAFAEGRLDGADGAGALYHQVLIADPGNAVAAHGLDQVGDALAAQARKTLTAGDRVAASAIIDKLAVLLPNYGELPALRASLVQVQKDDSGELDDAIKRGQDALRAGRMAGPGDDTALAYFKAALALDADNAEAKAGLGQVAQALIVQANAAIDDGDTAQAGKLIEQAAAWAPKSADLAAARARLSDAQKHVVREHTARAVPSTEEPVEATPATLTPQQSAELARMLQRADVAAKRGQIMLPPGESAYDLYRSALAIDGNNETARRGLQELPNVVARQFNQSLASGNLAQAGNRLADLSDLAPGDVGQGELRQRLASAWMDQADQQIARGDRPGATQSLDSARKLAPDHPRLRELTARVQAGR